MSNTLSKMTALVTGASRGIGYETALRLAKDGMQVVICSRNDQAIKKAAEDISIASDNVNVLGVCADISLANEVERLFAKLANFSDNNLNILINNAGYLELKSVIEMTESHWDHVINQNLKSTFLCSKKAMESMIKSGIQGKIVNVSSLAGIRGVEKFSGMAAYIASKHAVVGFTEALAVEAKDYGIKVNCVAPGSVATKMFCDNFANYEAGATPEEIARIIVAFCKDNQLGWQSGNIFEVFCNA